MGDEPYPIDLYLPDEVWASVVPEGGYYHSSGRTNGAKRHSKLQHARNAIKQSKAGTGTIYRAVDGEWVMVEHIRGDDA